MTLIVENHPFSKLARQIDNLLWASVILSTTVAALSLMNMGRLSLFMGPITFLITLTHNFILLRLTFLNRRRAKLVGVESINTSLNKSFPPTATKGNIVFLWILIILWSIVVCLIIVVSVIIESGGRFEAWERLAGFVELPTVVAEIALLVVVVLKCRKQRKSSIVQPERVDWEHYGTQQPQGA